MDGGLTFTVASTQFHDHAAPYLTRQIIPESSAKPQPDCIPAPLREDYYESCKIRDLSPKAGIIGPARKDKEIA